MNLFFLLIGLHALADYPLQGDFLAKAKNKWQAIPGVPWYQAMGSHCAIHALCVGVATGSLAIAMCEFAAHFMIDTMKCSGRLSFNQDQVAHVLCKAAWVLVIVYGH